MKKLNVRLPKSALLLASLLGSAGAALAQQPAPAVPQSAEEAFFGDTDIIVTARKREESLQEVPLSITAFGTQEIRSARIERLSDVAKLTPGLNFTPLFGAQNQLPIIRGAAQTFGALNVGVFLDGVYLSGKAAVDIELNDLERIEVVKGPQSALYGRNTFAGAINYITRAPSSEPEMNAEVTVGDHGLVKLRASASGPLTDKLGVRVGAYYREHNGFYTSAIDDGRVDAGQNYGAILTLQLKPSDLVTVTLRGTYAHEEVGQPPSNVIRTNAAPGRPAGSPAGTVRNLLYIGDVPEIPSDGVLVNTRSSPVAGDYGQTQTTYRTNLKIEIDSGPAIFTSLTSYDQRDTDYTFDGDNTICDTPSTAPVATGCPNFGFPFAPGSNIALGTSAFGTSSSTGSSRDIAQEVRLASPGGQRFDWLLGAYYYDNRSDFLERSLNPLTQANKDSFGFPRQVTTTKSMAVFGSATFRPTEAIGLTAEIRYENEAQRFTQTPTNGTPSTTIASRRVFDLKENFSFVTPRFIADYKTENALLYASVARGTKTGGFNTNLNVFDSQRSYSPEKSWNYEVGAKTDWMDNRLRFNIAGYYTDWQDQQVACQNPVIAGGSSTQRTYVCNVGQAEIYGIETELVARIGQIFTITGNYAWTNAKYKAFVDDSLAATLLLAGLPPIDFNGKRLPYVPEHKFVVSPRFNVPLGGSGWDAEARADLVYQSRSYVRADNLQSFAPKTLLDLRLGASNDRFGVQFFVNNVLDDRTPIAAVRFFDSVNFSVASPLVQGPEGRQFGVTLRAGF